jgi:hypothetical protein
MQSTFATIVSHVTTVHPRDEQRRDYGADREPSEVGAGHAPDFNLGESQIVDPRSADDR